MDDPAVSRAPVEIWRHILQIAVYDLDIFVIDPYDVPPSRFFNTLQRQYHSAHWGSGGYELGSAENDAYVQFMLFVSTIRSVCTTWNALGQEFSSWVVSLWNDVMSGSLKGQKAGMKRMSLAYKIYADLLPLPCGCELTDWCERCRSTRTQISQVTLPQIIRVCRRVSARIMDGMDERLLDTVLSSPNTIPNLLSLIVDISRMHPVSRFFDYFDAISKNFSSLVYLGLSLWVPRMASPPQPNLNLPRLKSLDLTIQSMDLTASDWKLPALTTLNIREMPLDNEQFFQSFSHIWPQILYLRFTEAPNLPGISHIWTTLPRIRALECQLPLFLTYPPPLDNPLEYLSYVYDSLLDEETGLDRLFGLLMERPQCHTIRGSFYWERAFHAIIPQNSREEEKRIVSSGGYPFRQPEQKARELLSIGSRLEEHGRRFKDSDGVAYSEAKARYQGAEEK